MPDADSGAAAAGEGAGGTQLVVGGLGAATLLEHIATFLCPEDTVRLMPVSQHWASALASDVAWEAHCVQLWAQKLYVPTLFASAGGGYSRLAAYWGSICDSRREQITATELCSSTWWLRAKTSAGAEAVACDPWWRDEPAARRHYSGDGACAESPTREHDVRAALPDAKVCGGPVLWRFPVGSSAQANRVRHTAASGREHPTHLVSRHEWGWVLQNQWSLLTSFPLPPRGEAPVLEDEGAVCRAAAREIAGLEVAGFSAGLPHGLPLPEMRPATLLPRLLPRGLDAGPAPPSLAPLSLAPPSAAVAPWLRHARAEAAGTALADGGDEGLQQALLESLRSPGGGPAAAMPLGGGGTSTSTAYHG